jgi:hypothetical protein
MVGQIRVLLCIVKPKSSKHGTFAFSKAEGLKITSVRILTNKSPEGRRQYFIKKVEFFRTVVELVKDFSVIFSVRLGNPIPCLDGKFSVFSELARNESSKTAEILTNSGVIYSAGSADGERTFIGKRTITLAPNSQSENDNGQILLQARRLHKLAEVGNYIWSENQMWQSQWDRKIHGDGPLPWP